MATIGTDGLLTAVTSGVVSVVATDTASSTTVTQNVTVVQIESLSILNNSATIIGDGPGTPANTDVCAAIKGAGEVLLQATLNPAIAEGLLPDGLVSWTGGEAVAGHPLQRKVSKGEWSKSVVGIHAGNQSAAIRAMVVYIIWAEPTGTKRDGTSFPDNSYPVLTGMYGPNSTNGAYESNIEIEFTIKPATLVPDAMTGLFDTNHIQWDVSRDKKVRYWQRISGTWILTDDRGSTWTSDDHFDDEEDNNPWDGNGHLYGTDGPSWIGQEEGLVSKLNMREWVRVGLGGTSGRNGTICSDYQYWRAFRSIILNGSSWCKDDAYDNELEEGNAFWGSVPPTQ